MIAAALLLSLAAFSGPTREWIEFVGFSRDGRLAAYHHDFDIVRGNGDHDRYTLMHTVDVRSGFVAAAFRISINRIAPNGRPIKVKRGELAATYANYERAYPSKSWIKLEKRSKFEKVALHTDPTMLQVGVDEDVQLQSGVTKDGLMLAAAPGSPLGFQVIARGKDGKAIDAGTFRREGVANQAIVARVQAFTARNRRGLAVLVVFLSQQGDEVDTLPEVKITSATLGKPAAKASPRVGDAADISGSGRKTVDPWKTRIDITAKPRLDQETRNKVPADERRQLQGIYKWFTGK